MAHGISGIEAANELGIGRATLYRWLSDPRPEFRAFEQAMRRAHGEAAVHMAANVVRQSDRDWRAAIAWLRADDPACWDPTLPPQERGRLRRSRWSSRH